MNIIERAYENALAIIIVWCILGIVFIFCFIEKGVYDGQTALGYGFFASTVLIVAIAVISFIIDYLLNKKSNKRNSLSFATLSDIGDE